MASSSSQSNGERNASANEPGEEGRENQPNPGQNGQNICLHTLIGGCKRILSTGFCPHPHKDPIPGVPILPVPKTHENDQKRFLCKYYNAGLCNYYLKPNLGECPRRHVGDINLGDIRSRCGLCGCYGHLYWECFFLICATTLDELYEIFNWKHLCTLCGWHTVSTNAPRCKTSERSCYYCQSKDHCSALCPEPHGRWHQTAAGREVIAKWSDAHLNVWCKSVRRRLGQTRSRRRQSPALQGPAIIQPNMNPNTGIAQPLVNRGIIDYLHLVLKSIVIRESLRQYDAFKGEQLQLHHNFRLILKPEFEPRFSPLVQYLDGIDLQNNQRTLECLREKHFSGMGPAASLDCIDFVRFIQINRNSQSHTESHHVRSYRLYGPVHGDDFENVYKFKFTVDPSHTVKPAVTNYIDYNIDSAMVYSMANALMHRVLYLCQPALLPVVAILRAWGQLNQPRLLSPYTITNMVIGFFQHCGWVPPLSQLHRSSLVGDADTTVALPRSPLGTDTRFSLEFEPEQLKLLSWKPCNLPILRVVESCLKFWRNFSFGSHHHHLWSGCHLERTDHLRKVRNQQQQQPSLKPFVLFDPLDGALLITERINNEQDLNVLKQHLDDGIRLFSSFNFI